ncbi:glycosyltransferase family 2 protein [Bizionia gelidisalsuginis]|uniref:Glycosyltransferase family 2 protein n=1 Tax=Bizionia gelidisalsuginis TaxID=291188 RepID=A0ABY3MDC5_9FLAO|nr:glycosyltransferase family A protein [Bizionia gelidisalsuginis]TYC17002.1 glycosyltransferase family 2 protein [Bizionia gelidisalsuginis]
MIIIYHNNGTVTRILDSEKNEELEVDRLSSISRVLLHVAEIYPNSIIVWCQEANAQYINLKYIATQFNNRYTMISFSEQNYMSDRIGYIEESPFLKINKSVKFPSWLMSSMCGAIHSQSILCFEKTLKGSEGFAYHLNAIAKLGMPLGLFCYSDPNLLFETASNKEEEGIRDTALFKFVKQHYKGIWVYLLFLNIALHEKRVLLRPLFLSLFSKKQAMELHFNQQKIISQSTIHIITEHNNYDVVIPTLGRVKYLYDVLEDLSKQTVLPTNVIIIEQDDREGAVSELQYLKTESWPFLIQHQFITQTGACNARNIALKEVKSPYVFLADDDIRFSSEVMERSIQFMRTNKYDAITLSCKRENEIDSLNTAIQWPAFGSGCSIIKTAVLKNIRFNTAFEHGFGEDSDFGAQLRRQGVDVVYFPKGRLIHLKAPIGGFRTPFQHVWNKEEIQPKPSPTVLLYQLLNNTSEQLNGYKLILFIKYYRLQHTKNPYLYFRKFKKQWAVSMHWATVLKAKYVQL